MTKKAGNTTGQILTSEGNSVSIPLGNLAPGQVVVFNQTPHEVQEVQYTFNAQADNTTNASEQVMRFVTESTTAGTPVIFNSTLSLDNHDDPSPIRWSTSTSNNTGAEWASTDTNGLTWYMAGGGHNHGFGGGLRMNGDVQLELERPHPSHWGIMYERGEASPTVFRHNLDEPSKLTQKQLEKLNHARQREQLKLYKKHLKERDFARRKIAKAKKKADQLLRKWLTKNEYNALKHQDGLKVQSKLYKDVTYVVRSLSYQRVERWARGKLTHLLCVVSRDPGYENDDTVLQKILMLQTNERQFLETAVVSYVK